MAIVNAIKKVRKHLEILIDGERICITKSTASVRLRKARKSISMTISSSSFCTSTSPR